MTEQDIWVKLSAAAWDVRERARDHVEKTMVGAAIHDERGTIHVGCNFEHRFRTMSVHAEVSAIAAMIAGGGGVIEKIIVVSTRERLTPCGACRDLIYEYGHKQTEVAYQNNLEGAIHVYSLDQLIPLYPR